MGVEVVLSRVGARVVDDTAATIVPKAREEGDQVGLCTAGCVAVWVKEEKLGGNGGMGRAMEMEGQRGSFEMGARDNDDGMEWDSGKRGCPRAYAQYLFTMYYVLCTT